MIQRSMKRMQYQDVHSSRRSSEFTEDYKLEFNTLLASTFLSNSIQMVILCKLKSMMNYDD